MTSEVIRSGIAEIDEAIGLGGLPRATIVELHGLGSTDSLRLSRRICSPTDGRAQLLKVGGLDGGQDVWLAVERAIRNGMDLVALVVTDRVTVKDSKTESALTG